MMTWNHRALLPVLFLAIAGCNSSSSQYYFKYKLPPPDEPVEPGLTPDNTIHCGNPVNYRDLTNPCTKPGDAIDVSTPPPLQLADGGLPSLQDPPSPWPEDPTTNIDVCPNIPKPDGSFDTLRVEMPCVGATGTAGMCKAPPLTSRSVVIAGKSGESYLITIRVRGVVEVRAYQDGTASKSSPFYIGGSAPKNEWGTWTLTTQTGTTPYFLNSGKPSVVGVDYLAVIEGKAGDALTLTADPSDATEHRNLSSTTMQPIIIDDVDPAPNAFDGNFLQVDWVSADEIIE